MEWREQGIIVGTRKHGETSLIVELMTQSHGRHMGLVRGGRSRKVQPTLQPGNRVEATWRARIDEHLGTYVIEPVQMDAARLMETACGVHGIQLIGAHLRLLPERDPHPALFGALEVLVQHLDNPALAGPLMVRFELRLLEELGFGLDLTRCAASGATTDLIYVSPRSGQAVSRIEGAPWADKMLPLPTFLTAAAGRSCTADELVGGFKTSGFFLARDVYTPRGTEPPSCRESFMASIVRALNNVA